jgi:hypothetical protein
MWTIYGAIRAFGCTDWGNQRKISIILTGVGDEDRQETHLKLYERIPVPTNLYGSENGVRKNKNVKEIEAAKIVLLKAATVHTTLAGIKTKVLACGAWCRVRV